MHIYYTYVHVGQLSKQSEREADFDFWELFQAPDPNLPFKSRQSSATFKGPSVEQTPSEKGRGSHKKSG